MAERKKSEKTETVQKGAASKDAKAGAKPKRGSRAASKTEAKGATKAKSETKAKSTSKSKTAAKARTTKAKTPAKSKPAAKPKEKAKPEEPKAPVVRARARYVRVAPRKVRLVADQIRGLAIDDARSLLQFSARGAARDLHKLIDSAAANAENNHDLIADDLRVAEIRVDEGPTLRRYRPRALGRATRIDKRTSHISVALTPEED